MYKYFRRLYYLTVIYLRSYYCKKSSIVTILLVPYSAFIFIVLSGYTIIDTMSTESKVIYIASLAIINTVISGLSMPGKFVAMEKSYRRIQLLRVNGISYHTHIIVLFLIGLIVTIFNLFVLCLFSLFVFEINILPSLFLITILCTVGSLALIGPAYFIGIKSSDIISANAYCNLLGSALILFAGIFRLNNNVDSFLDKYVFQVSPFYSLRKYIENAIIDHSAININPIPLLLLLLLSVILIFLNRQFLDKML